MLLNCGIGEDSWESLGLQGDPTSPSSRRSVLGVHWDWCWSWNSNTLATWWEELTHLKRPWCWERLRAGGEGDNRGWDGWMASPTQWTWVWVNSGSWWWTGKPGVLWFMGLQRVRHDWVTELNWELFCRTKIFRKWKTNYLMKHSSFRRGHSLITLTTTKVHQETAWGWIKERQDLCKTWSLSASWPLNCCYKTEVAK